MKNLKHYVDFYLPGKLEFFNEHKIQEVPERSLESVKVPKRAFAYRFFDQSEDIVNGETLVGNRTNFSPVTFFGTAYTLEEVKEQFPWCFTLISNMEWNGYNRVVLTSCGFYHLREEDIVI